MNISLTPALEQYVRHKAESGDYNNASEVVREALRLLKQRDETHAAKLQKLREALDDGAADIAAGRVSAFQSEEEFSQFFDRL